MKKLILILVLSVALCLVISCGDDKKDGQVSIKVDYVATEGGYILGESTQSKETREGNIVAFSPVEAVANEGYIFVGWDDGTTKPERKDVLNESKTFVAQFEKLNYINIKYSAKEGGMIEGVSEQKLLLGEKTTQVKAIPNEEYKFIGWSDGVTTDTRDDVANADMEIVALFEKLQLVTITYKCENGGRLVGTSVQRVPVGEYGREVSLIISSGYHFKGWDDGVKTEKRQDIATVDVTYTAKFSSGANVVYEATEGGKVLGKLIQRVNYGSVSSKVTAIPDEGYGFAGWSDGNMDAERSDAPEDDITYTAIFKKLYTVTFVSAQENKGFIKGKVTQSVCEGFKFEKVQAMPQYGCQFVCWDNGSKESVLQLEVYEDMTFVAYFCEESTGLPVISVYTENNAEIVSKEAYLKCTVTVFDPENDDNNKFEKTGKIKGRGNSTWGLDKKPYKIKFDDKKNLFGFGKAKDWVLLANYIDRSLMRNELTYKVAKQLSSLVFSPDCQQVEVYLNGQYQGVYLLCEQVEVNKHRVEVSEDTTKVDTGYLVEMDGWKDGVCIYVPDRLSTSRAYVIKFPDDELLTNDHKEFIRDYLVKCIEAAQSGKYSEVEKLIDVKSFAQAYIIFELFKCPDADYSSFYMYKDAGGKLCCGPVWDFDMGIGNVTHKGNAELRNYDSLWVRQLNPWFSALLSHEEFCDLVGQELVDNEQLIKDTLFEVYKEAYTNTEAMKKNFVRWNIMGKDLWTNPPEFKQFYTWGQHVEFTRDYLTNGLEFLINTYYKKQ